MSVTSACLVFGFIAGVDDVAPAAARTGLTRRFALAFISHGEDVRDSALDRRAFRASVAALAPLWPTDHVVANGHGARASTFASVLAAIDHESCAGDDLFETLTLTRAGQSVCLIRHLPYHRIGGPAPYHDTFAFEFFVAAFDDDDIERRLRRASEGAPFALEIVRGSPGPMRGWLARARRRFRRPERRRPAR